ncbi:Fruit protein pKIWI502 [Seminavis robusta]|uniref:Fruit protein pKIWI502 n=1 Tax=Seminavis robusta TaxID=568900 RepID=A0A9N8HGR6_9STRA|nr:Fruit protein pKIWI502 [Seminavis robusta]|eukprot:Sro654_g182030.1 Fruit protein pKIWI502 (310) ;mRNA; f:18249-19178
MISSGRILLLLAAAISSASAFVAPVPKPSVLTTTTNTQQLPIAANNNEANIRRGTVLFMGWGPDPIWSPATVTSNEKACQSGSCVSITLSVNPETAAEYAIPGQYVQMRLDGDTKPLFLAIASGPDKENASFEFLIKKTEGNEWITSAASGTTVEMSQVLGGGFPMDENLEGFKYDFPTQNVLLFAAGSGIAPIKAAMESGQLNVAGSGGGGGRTARLYYGVQNPDELCFVESFGQWEQMGYQIVPVLSQPPADWEGRTGYVQAALEEDGVPIPRNSGALMCGMKGMAEAVKDILVKAGVFEGRVLTNF